MNFKNILKTFSMAALLASSVTSVQAADLYKLDQGHLNVMFFVDHLGFSQLLGRFDEVSGEFSYDKTDIEKSSVKVQINTDSINTFHAKRDKHLKSPDFFNTAEFPDMSFESTSIIKTGKKTAKLTGNLTLMGVTKPVTLQMLTNRVGVHNFNKKNVAGFSAEGKIKRTHFGMRYGVPVIGDEVTIRIEAEGIKE